MLIAPLACVALMLAAPVVPASDLTVVTLAKVTVPPLPTTLRLLVLMPVSKLVETTALPAEPPIVVPFCTLSVTLVPRTVPSVSEPPVVPPEARPSDTLAVALVPMVVLATLWMAAKVVVLGVALAACTDWMLMLLPPTRLVAPLSLVMLTPGWPVPESVTALPVMLSDWVPLSWYPKDRKPATLTVGSFKVLIVPLILTFLPTILLLLGFPMRRMPSEVREVLEVATVTLANVPSTFTAPLAFEMMLGLSLPMTNAATPCTSYPAPLRLEVMLMAAVAELPVMEMVDFLIANAPLWVCASTVPISVPVRF